MHALFVSVRIPLNSVGQGGNADVFNPQDTSWIERASGGADEMEQEPRVREVSNQAVPARPQIVGEPIQVRFRFIDITVAWSLTAVAFFLCCRIATMHRTENELQPR